MSGIQKTNKTELASAGTNKYKNSGSTVVVMNVNGHMTSYYHSLTKWGTDLMSYGQAKIHLKINGWETVVTQYAIMYTKDAHHQIHYRTDIRHFEPRTFNTETKFAAAQANAVLFGGFYALQHVKPRHTFSPNYEYEKQKDSHDAR